ncbi:MAG TPA: TIGR03790 family protein [Bryobacteraceae bacterium]|nr:TIGR03790 family protein [Bryobacteraceae bacterium]
MEYTITAMALVRRSLAVVCLLGAAAAAFGSKPENVLVVVNRSSAVSRSIGDYYSRKRGIAKANLCEIETKDQERITRQEYLLQIAQPIRDCLSRRGLIERILYIVTTKGVPLHVTGTRGLQGTYASVDSELTLLYGVLKGAAPPAEGPLRNPFFANTEAEFTHRQFPIYLVTRLAAYDLAEVKAMIDRSTGGRNLGKVILDLRADGAKDGDDWLRRAAFLLARDRVHLDETRSPVHDQHNVIGYASWGSNDPARKRRRPGFQWLPGAIATEYVSTNGRTFSKPPDTWTISTWKEREKWFAGSPQTLAADFIAEGASGAAGHTDEPYLPYTPRPDYLFPAYLAGRNLAESFWMSIPALSWQNVVIGDPLCRLAK